MPKPQLSIDPCDVIGEILGAPSRQMREPVNAGYLCPFINSTCKKSSQRMPGVPYPVCSVHRSGPVDAGSLICLCPKRFYQVDFLHDVVEHCWIGPPPNKLRIAHEVKMADFGQVDFVLADVDENMAVTNFVSVELQAMDITGSCEPAYSSVLNSGMLARRPTFNFNYANVRKRYISQLIAKGFYHHHWGSRIIAVLQDHIYAKMRQFAAFDELPSSSPTANIVFLLYKYVGDATTGYRLEIDRAVGTSHNSLMMGALYKTPPDRSVFHSRILSRIGR